jgi:hypothetical protein
VSTLLVLHDIRLVPAVELEPFKFATQEHPQPFGPACEVPAEWGRYWRASLADSGLVGLTPLRLGSWHVPTTGFTDLGVLGKFLAKTLADWGGAETLADPDCDPVLCGGMALCQGDEVLAEPTCCVDLRNFTDWRAAASYRGPDWQILWIGHPWLSVRFDAGWLLLSDPHESAAPVARWAVTPENLLGAIALAEAELEQFAGKLWWGLEGLVEAGAAAALARRLAGLPQTGEGVPASR